MSSCFDVTRGKYASSADDTTIIGVITVVRVNESVKVEDAKTSTTIAGRMYHTQPHTSPPPHDVSCYYRSGHSEEVRNARVVYTADAVAGSCIASYVAGANPAYHTTESSAYPSV